MGDQDQSEEQQELSAPLANAYGKPEQEKDITETLATITEQVQDAVVTAKKASEKADKTSDETKQLQEDSKNTRSLVIAAIYILIFMVVTMAITITIYEIQTVNQNNEQIIQLLKK